MYVSFQILKCLSGILVDFFCMDNAMYLPNKKNLLTTLCQSIQICRPKSPWTFHPAADTSVSLPTEGDC